MRALSPRLRHVLHPIRALPPRHWLSAPQLLPPSQTDSCQHALGHVMSVLPHHPRKPTYSTRPNPILDAASSSPQGYLASSPPRPRKMPQHFLRFPGLSRRVCVHFARCACVSQFDPGPSGRPTVWRNRSCDGKISHHHARIAIDWTPFIFATAWSVCVHGLMIGPHSGRFRPLGHSRPESAPQMLGIYPLYPYRATCNAATR